MKLTYYIAGMTCGSCEQKVKTSLLKISDIQYVDVSKESATATIETARPLSLNELQDILGGPDSKYQISGKNIETSKTDERSFLETYKPLFILFIYIISISVLFADGGWMAFMRIFMAGFFLSFSFFKLINLRAFAESYAMYDIVAKKFNVWGYIYAFIELVLGLAFAINFEPVLTNTVTLVVMSISIIGVIQSVVNKKQIRCACLGAVFNLPMSSITIIEDALMIVMSAGMLWMIT